MFLFSFLEVLRQINLPLMFIFCVICGQINIAYLKAFYMLFMGCMVEKNRKLVDISLDKW